MVKVTKLKGGLKMSDNVIELPGYQEKMRGLTKRVEMLEQLVVQLDANLASFSLGASIVIEAIRKLLVAKKLVSDTEIQDMIDELMATTKQQMLEMMRKNAFAQQPLQYPGVPER